MTNNWYIPAAIMIMAAVTLLLRAVPFLIFGGKRRVPAYIARLSSRLPYAVMAILVIYCLRNITFTQINGFAAELLSAGVVIGLHLWKHNTILSIAAGTVSYMLLVQLVFV